MELHPTTTNHADNCPGRRPSRPSSVRHESVQVGLYGQIAKLTKENAEQKAKIDLYMDALQRLEQRYYELLRENIQTKASSTMAG